MDVRFIGGSEEGSEEKARPLGHTPINKKIYLKKRLYHKYNKPC